MNYNVTAQNIQRCVGSEEVFVSKLFVTDGRTDKAI